MEIIQERLEREFDLNIITTAPSVIYRVTKLDGEVLMIQNPANLPAPAEISTIEEPIVNSDIIVPKDYVGVVMELCQERRGTMKNMEYIDDTRVMLHYELPLNEVIYDFFDALKSRTRGYGSIDYEMKGYVVSDLVKMDILINKEQVDALSFIIHETRAFVRGKAMCEKLKDEIPRHSSQFQFRQL